MVYLRRALISLSGTFLSYVVSGNSMTWLTKMSCSPAKPNRNIAAKLAFEFYVVLSMLRTFCFSSQIKHFIWAFTTNEIFLFKIAISFHIVSTLFQTTKIRNLAFKAHIIWKSCQSILLKIVVIGVLRIFKSLILIKFFNNCPFHRFLKNNLIKCDTFFHFSFDFWMMICLDSLFAGRTEKEFKSDPRSNPFVWYLLQDAIYMKNMFAS